MSKSMISQTLSINNSILRITFKREELKSHIIAHIEARFFAVSMSFIAKNNLVSFKSYTQFTKAQK